MSFLGGILVFILSMILLSSQSSSIIDSGDFDDPSSWLTHGHGVSRIRDGKVFLEINDTQGKWLYSRVQQGILPHDWMSGTPLNEIKVRRYLEASTNVLFMRIVATRSAFQHCNETKSDVNFGVILWFALDDNYDLPINQSEQLSLDIRFYSTIYGNRTVSIVDWDYYFKGQYVEGVHNDNDYHYFTNSETKMLENDTLYDVTVDVGQCIEKAFDRYGIIEARLKDFDIFIEANYGYGSVIVYEVEFLFSPRFYSRPVIVQSTFYGLLTFFVVFLTSMILKRAPAEPKKQERMSEIRGQR